MGSVVLARVAGAGGVSRQYALKILHKHLMYDSEFVDMLLDEARIASRIHHPNAVAIHEVGLNETHGYYVVMDYVEGVTLWDVNHQLGPASPGRVKLVTRCVYDALMGLEAAHTLTDEMGKPLAVVHRDISPQNILVGVDGIARVTDFGIAKAAARITGTTPGQVKGKLAYMAPEQARGRPLDHRVDLFAMGVVLWEMLTGQRLFKRPKESDTVEALLVAPIPRPKSLVPSLPDGLDAVCMQALERNRDERFGSARAMATALEHTARAANLFADAHEVGGWVRNAFKVALDTRREAIRQAAASTPVARVRGQTGELVVPSIPEVRTIKPVTPPPTPKTVTDLQDEWEKHASTISTIHPPVKIHSKSPIADEALDLMKTTAMPQSEQPNELQEAIAQYRQKFADQARADTPAEPTSSRTPSASSIPNRGLPGAPQSAPPSAPRPPSNTAAPPPPQWPHNAAPASVDQPRHHFGAPPSQGFPQNQPMPYASHHPTLAPPSPSYTPHTIQAQPPKQGSRVVMVALLVVGGVCMLFAGAFVALRFF